MKLFVEGGSLALWIRLRLAAGDPRKPDLTIKAVFFAWAHQETETPRPQATVTSMEAAKGKFTFSSGLVDLQWEQLKSITAAFLAQHAGLLGRSDHRLISWKYANPVCLNFNRKKPQEDDGLVYLHRQVFGTFLLLRSGTIISVFEYFKAPFFRYAYEH